MNQKLASILAATAFGSLALGGAAALADGPEEAARGLLRRVLPAHDGDFAFETIAADHGSDVFEVESVNGKIVVRGNNGVAMASGLNWYLKHRCYCHLSFCGDQLKLPDPLPALERKVRRASPHQYRYFFNYCTFSYTMAWWDWAQWERMIDWMALHGVNMPLAVTGQEAVWQNVCRRFGLTDKQIQEFFVGPAYLPFGWMGCIDGWCGPLPDGWIDSHVELEKKIVARERALGMKPVLQGFTGHIPAGFKEKFPNAKFGQLAGWSGFHPGTHFIDPMDPLFAEVGKAFIEEQTRLFGTDHLYAADTFIEMRPPSDDPAFLAALGKAIHGALQAGDPDAVWVMQGWIFLSEKDFWKPPQAKAFFGAVPDDRMILLDLFCEADPVWQQKEAFYGKPWVWCVLHNFGGKVGLYGGTHRIAQNLNEAMTSPKHGKLSGIGMTMEGFGYNPVVYDLVTDMTWRRRVPPLDAWFGDFVHRRYGCRNARALEAWRLLETTVYRQTSYTGTAVCARPGLPADRNWVNRPARFDRSKLLYAWSLLLECRDELGGLDTYQYDVVHVARENMAALADDLATQMYAAYEAKDREALAAKSREYLELIRDLDDLLATRQEFLLGKWLSDARRWGGTDADRGHCEHNARRLITLWGPADSGLHEYAHRQWSGLVRGFYLRRWEQFIERLDESLAKNEPLDAKWFDSDIRAWEEKWTHENESYATTPQGDPVAVSLQMWKKYGPRVASPHRRQRLEGGPAAGGTGGGLTLPR